MAEFCGIEYCGAEIEFNHPRIKDERVSLVCMRPPNHTGDHYDENNDAWWNKGILPKESMSLELPK